MYQLKSLLIFHFFNPRCRELRYLAVCGCTNPQNAVFKNLGWFTDYKNPLFCRFHPSRRRQHQRRPPSNNSNRRHHPWRARTSSWPRTRASGWRGRPRLTSWATNWWSASSPSCPPTRCASVHGCVGGGTCWRGTPDSGPPSPSAARPSTPTVPSSRSPDYWPGTRVDAYTSRRWVGGSR